MSLLARPRFSAPLAFVRLDPCIMYSITVQFIKGTTINHLAGERGANKKKDSFGDMQKK